MAQASQTLVVNVDGSFEVNGHRMAVVGDDADSRSWACTLDNAPVRVLKASKDPSDPVVQRDGISPPINIGAYLDQCTVKESVDPTTIPGAVKIQLRPGVPISIVGLPKDFGAVDVAFLSQNLATIAATVKPASADAGIGADAQTLKP